MGDTVAFSVVDQYKYVDSHHPTAGCPGFDGAIALADGAIMGAVPALF
jgi:hypothetical protein